MSGTSGRKVILCCLLFICAAPAVDSPATPYVVSTTGTGLEIKWPVRSASYLLNAAGSPPGSLEAILGGMQTWTDVPASSFVFAYAGTTASSAHGKNDGQNILTFAHMGSSGTLAENVFWYKTGTGEILDSDIRFNTNYAWSASGEPGEYDVQNIGTHELGHSLSLDDLYDVADGEKTMYGYASPGETKKRRSIRTTSPESSISIPDGARAGISTGTGKPTSR